MARLDRTKLGMMAVLTLGAGACSPERAATSGGAGGAPVTGAGGANGASSTASTSHASSAASTSAVVEGSVGAGGSGSVAPTCNPPAAVGSFYAQSAPQFGNVSPTSMCDYRGDVLLVVNTAAV
jgi:hypothetical protein